MSEPVAWRYQRKEWDALLWRYQTEALVNDDFETPSDWLIEPLYAIPASPQPRRERRIERGRSRPAQNNPDGYPIEEKPK